MLPGSCCIAIATLEPVNGDSWYHMCAFRFHFWGRKVNWNQASHVRASSVLMVDYCPLRLPLPLAWRRHLGREAVGGGYNNPLLAFFKVFFVFGLIYLKYCMVVWGDVKVHLAMVPVAVWPSINQSSTGQWSLPHHHMPVLDQGGNTVNTRWIPWSLSPPTNL